jgi:hypothetical protein
MSHPIKKICPACGAEMPFKLVQPVPEVNCRWECPRDGIEWNLADDGSRLVPFGPIRREPTGRPRPPRVTAQPRRA